MAVNLIQFIGDLDFDYSLYKELSKKNELIALSSEIHALNQCNKILLTKNALYKLQSVNREILKNKQLRKDIINKYCISNISIDETEEKNFVQMTAKDVPGLLNTLDEFAICANKYIPKELAKKILYELKEKRKFFCSNIISIELYMNIYKKLLKKYNELMNRNIANRKETEKIVGVKRKLQNSLLAVSTKSELIIFLYIVLFIFFFIYKIKIFFFFICIFTFLKVRIVIA